MSAIDRIGSNGPNRPEFIAYLEIVIFNSKCDRAVGEPDRVPTGNQFDAPPTSENGPLDNYQERRLNFDNATRPEEHATTAHVECVAAAAN